MITTHPKIVPHLWFDREAQEAAIFYVSVFAEGSRLTGGSEIPDTPSGDAFSVSFELCGQEFRAISAGPYFKFNPSISFLVSCRSTTEVDRLWQALIQGGTPLMPLDTYPFSRHFGWLADRYGLSWQIMVEEEAKVLQKISPALLFVGPVCGKTEEAVHFYTSLFPNSRLVDMERYGKGEDPAPEGTVKQARFILDNQLFRAMDSAYPHEFAFNEAISFMVLCDSQVEIDHYWEALSAVPEAEQCGWLKDRFGVSWQIVPSSLGEMMQSGDPEVVARVTQAFLKMKKFNLESLQRAYAGKGS
jgi:predicted 3-demethylubiquinone-9 3-methyltransferase (glyoxalase superfamily)